jgi:hypothetical protein
LFINLIRTLRNAHTPIRPFSTSDAKIIGPAEVDANPRLLGQQISARISKNIGWADR